LRLGGRRQTSLKLGIDVKTKPNWLKYRDEFIGAKERLLELAHRGEQPRYKQIVDDPMTTQPVGYRRWEPEPPKFVFELWAVDELEAKVHKALRDYHDRIRRLKKEFRVLRCSEADPDFTSLTNSEIAFIKSKP
jgi:hypothetical protein